MNIIITGNVSQGFEFFGPFEDINETSAQNLLDEHPEGVWAELQSLPEVPVKPLFTVRKVNLENKWTVLRYEDKVCLGGDHHWLSQALAMAAASVYRQFPSMHGALPEEVENLFKSLNKPGMWPTYHEPKLTEVSDGTVPSYLPKSTADMWKNGGVLHSDE